MASIYATEADFDAFVEGWTTDDPAALGRLLERAELDIDLALAPLLVPYEATGRRFDVTPTGPLTAQQKQELKLLTCAQAEYRWTVEKDDPEFFVRAQFTRVKGPDFEVEGERPYYGPKVKRLLAGCSLVQRAGARAVP